MRPLILIICLGWIPVLALAQTGVTFPHTGPYSYNWGGGNISGTFTTNVVGTTASFVFSGTGVTGGYVGTFSIHARPYGTGAAYATASAQGSTSVNLSVNASGVGVGGAVEVRVFRDGSLFYHAYGVPVPADEHWLKAEFTNPHATAITIRLTQGGVTKFTVPLAPGQTVQFAEKVAEPGSYYAVADFTGTEYLEGIGWIATEGVTTSVEIPPTLATTTDPQATPTAVPVPMHSTNSAVPPALSPGGTKDSPIVWQRPITNGGADGLTTADYRQGVGEIVAAVRAAGAGGGAGGTDMSGVESRIDGTNTKLDTLIEQRKGVAEREAAALEAADTAESGRQAQGAAERSAAEAAVQASGAAMPGSLTLGGGSSGALSVALPGYGTLNLDPASHPQLSAAMDWVKGLIAFVVVGLFQWWLWKEFQTVYAIVVGSQQAVGNPVAGGTGAQATALIAALAISGVLVSVPGLFWAAADSGLTVSLGNFNPFNSAGSSAVSAGIYLSGLVMPWSTIAAVIVQVFVVRKAGLVIIAGVQAAIRFIVP